MAKEVTAALAVISTSRLKFLNTSLILIIEIKDKRGNYIYLSINYPIVVF